jgi:mannose-1-phosphate guanylyltransferase
MNGRYIVVMAGGSGTRFWPKSRAHHPKQFLSIGSERSLLRATIERVIGVGAERIYVVTAAAHAQHATASLPELPRENILIEPEGRNTAPCIGWATRAILARDPGAQIAVLPADHYIADPDGFRAHLDAAFAAATDRIVLFGIIPTHPETGYGYINRGDKLRDAAGRAVHAVARFVEKPDRDTALRYLAEGTYLWNSGMFVFPAALMAAELERLLPALAEGLARLAADPSKLAELYPSLPSISIDYGVMEKSDRIAVMPAAFGWSDVGSWDAAMEIGRPDEDGNVLEGDALIVGAKRSMVDAKAGRFVALVGVEDVIVVDTEDAVLVIKRGDAQRVKHVVDALKTKGRKELL